MRYLIILVLLILAHCELSIAQSEYVFNPDNGSRITGELLPFDTVPNRFNKTVNLPYAIRQEWKVLCATIPPKSGLIKLTADQEDPSFWTVSELKAHDLPNPILSARKDLTLVIAGLKDYKVSTRLILLLDSQNRELGWIEATGDLAHVYAGDFTGEGYLEILSVESTGDAIGYAQVWRYIPNIGIRSIYQTPEYEPMFIWRDYIKLAYSNLDGRPLTARHLPSVKLILIKQLLPGLLYREVYQYSKNQQNYVQRSTYFPRLIAPQFNFYTHLLDNLQAGCFYSPASQLFLNSEKELDENKYSMLVNLVRQWKYSPNIEVLERTADNY